MLICSKAPLRLGLAGGGTDVSPYSDEFGGHVLNATIDKYAYCTIEVTEDNKISFYAADRNEFFAFESKEYLELNGFLDLHKGVYNRIVKQFNNNKPLSFKMITFSDAPAGSGLGSSSTLVVAILKAFEEWLNLPLGKYDLAHLAYEIERVDVGLSGGKQDQYAATFGGFNFIDFYAGDRVIVNPLRIKNRIINELENSIILYYTGISRESAKIIDEQSKNVKEKNLISLQAMHELKANALIIKEALLKGDIKKFANYLGKSWEVKKRIATIISNKYLDMVCAIAIEAGAYAAKVSGAGGGGVIMFVVDPINRLNVIKELNKLAGQIIDFHFTDNGTQSFAGNKLPVKVISFFYNSSGYAEEARNMVLNLDKEKFRVKLIPTDNQQGIAEVLDAETSKQLDELVQSAEQPNSVNLIWLPGDWAANTAAAKDAKANAIIIRTMFETDRIPPDWVITCNNMDEIWVPTQFNVETFTAAGVNRDKLFVIPQGIDSDRFSPDVIPRDWPDKKGFNFLSVFVWQDRKGWDVLLKAYLTEFNKIDDVALVLKVGGPAIEEVESQIIDYIHALGFDLNNIPALFLVDKPCASKEMAALYAACDAFVLPSRGEGWGRPYMEAMATGLPTIGTRWSGQLAFMNDENSYLIDIDGLEVIPPNVDTPYFRGHSWARPSLQHTGALMRQVYENRDQARAKGSKARQDMIEKWSWSKAVEKVEQRLELYRKELNLLHAVKANRGMPGNKLPVRWTSVVYNSSGYAEEARNMVLNLDEEKFQVKLIPIDNQQGKPQVLDAETRKQLDLLVRAADQANSVNLIWSTPYYFARDPKAIVNIGRTMFETDRIPPDWVISCNTMDEIWLPTQFNVETFAAAGVNRDKLFVIPQGIDIDRFSPDVIPRDWPDKKGFNFLSVFEWIYRKGWDILLKAYLTEFNIKDDVALILKASVSAFSTIEEVESQIIDYIYALGFDANNIPALFLVDKPCTSKEMAALYAACDAFVLPSRGEGWGRPYMEAMATGLPTIGTRWSGQLAFMHDENSYLIDINGLEDVPPIEHIPYRGHLWARPSLQHTMALMRQVYENRDQARAKGNKARQDMIENWSWSKAVEKVEQRLGLYCKST